ncbi:MAG: hypothetical protein WAM30_00055 [Candidatus Dormiibacterota bacterium]
MATHPDHHPLDDEIEEMYARNPGLQEELDKLEGRIARGEEAGVGNTEVRRRLLALGLPLHDQES